MMAKEELPPKEPMCLRLSNLYGSCDKKIQSFITEHCSHCSSFYESNLHSSSSQCEEQLCVYIYWHYRHYWLKHKRVEPTEACSGCDSCLKLHRWISLHAPECLKQLSHCCLSLCQQMKQSQHLSNLGKADHNFMSQIESRSHLVTSPQPPNSLSGVTHQFYNGDLPHSLAGDRTLLSQYQRGNTPTHSMLPQKLINSPGHSNCTPLMEEQRSLQHSSSSASLSQARRQMPASSHRHCQSNSNLQAQQSNYCNFDPSTLMMREADSNAQYNPPDLSAQHQQQWVAPSDLSPHSIHVMSSTRHNGASPRAVIQTQYSTSMANGDCYAVNGVRTHAMGYDAMQTSSNQLATPTGDLKLSRQCSNTSSGYGTASSTGTGRHSVISILSRDQSLSEIVDPENALQVGSTPHRKASAPGPNFNSKAKKMLNQQSQSLTDLAQNIPEYPYDHEEKECNEDKECNGHLSLQRQDTGHSTKVVFAGLGDSVSGEHYKSVMESKRKMPKQASVEEAVESSLSLPVTKRPLQREQSDVSGKDKIVLGGGDGRSGSISLTRDQYDSIFKFQEQRGILSDQQTREKVLGKQCKQAVVAENHLRRGTMNIDVVSDFDTESSTSDIQGSFPLTSSDFSELDQDLTDQEEDKKVVQMESKMTVEEQVRMIQAMKAGKMSLPVNMANPELYHDRARTKKQHFSHAMSSPLLPPETMSTYTPSSHPLHSLPQGTRHTTLTPRNSSSTISDGASTLESERFSNNTLKEEENCYGSNRVSIGSCGPATHSSTDGSTLTGGSFEGRFTSLRLSSNTSSERNEDALGMVNSPAPSSLPVLQSSLACHMQGQLSASSPMDMSQSDAERNSYHGMQSEEVQSMESDICGSLSPVPPPFQLGRYKLASSQVQQMCQRVDDLMEKYHHDLLRIRHKGQLMHQGAPNISDEEQQRKIPVIRQLSPFSLYSCENSPQALFMKASEFAVDLTFEPSPSNSLIDKTKAVVIGRCSVKEAERESEHNNISTTFYNNWPEERDITSSLTSSQELEYENKRQGSLTSPVQKSAHFWKAENETLIPFLHHHLLECDCNAQSYTIDGHDITLKIPEGAVDEGQIVHFEIGVALYGPFHLPESTQPISPIIWVCLLEEHIELKKPFQLIVPHILTQLSKKRFNHHEVRFAKASHDYCISSSGNKTYKFYDCNTEPLFVSIGHRSYGVLVSKHFCFYCLQAKKTAELAKDAGYSLVRIENSLTLQRNEIFFCAIYLLETCFRSLEDQFPREECYRISSYDFKFSNNDETPKIKIIVPSEHCHCEAIAMDPVAAEIRALDIDFWSKGFDSMRLRHARRMYPPRVKMTITLKDFSLTFKLLVKFIGCSQDSNLDVELTFPFSSSSLMSPTSSVSSASHNTDPQSHKIKCGKPKLGDAFKKLLPISKEWKNIGALLDIPSGTLDNLEREEHDMNSRLRAMLTEWLKQVDPPTTWTQLIDAVEPLCLSTAEKLKVHVDLHASVMM